MKPFIKMTHKTLFTSTFICFILVCSSSTIPMIPYFTDGNLYRLILVDVLYTVLYFIISMSMKKSNTLDEMFEEYFSLPDDFEAWAYSKEFSFSLILRVIKFFFLGMYIKILLPSGIICFINSIFTNQTGVMFILETLSLGLRFTVAMFCIRFLWQDTWTGNERNN